METPLKRTPLHAFHIDHGARMVPFAGWEMPVQYTSILEEHRAVRNAAGLFDVSHMGEARVHGAEACLFLNHLVTNDVNRLEIGKALYTVMCHEDGGVVDDLIIYQVGDEEYFLCLNAANVEKDIEWMEGQAVGFDCLVDDISDDFGQLALQGPRAIPIFEEVTGLILDDLGRFRFKQAEILGTQALNSRTGYTGEDGLELYLPAKETARIANHLLESGKAHGLLLTGLGARDSLRLEAGFPLYGHEISGQIDPLTGGLGWVVKLQKPEPFLGRKALQSLKEAGLERQVVFFRLEDRRIARQGTAIFDGAGDPCGSVLSGTQSPMTGRPIGSALLSRKALASGGPLFASVRQSLLQLEIAKPPLHQQG